MLFDLARQLWEQGTNRLTVLALYKMCQVSMSLSKIILYFCTTGKSITFTNLLLYLKILLSHFDSLVSIHVLERNLFLSLLTRKRRFWFDPTPGCSLQRVTKTLLIPSLDGFSVAQLHGEEKPLTISTWVNKAISKTGKFSWLQTYLSGRKLEANIIWHCIWKKITDLWNILTSLCLYDLQEILSSEKARSRLAWIVSTQMCIKLWI